MPAFIMPAPPINELYEDPCCPLCGSMQKQPRYRREIASGTKLGTLIIQVCICAECGFIYNAPRLRTEFISEYYTHSPLASGKVFRSTEKGAHYPTINAERLAFIQKHMSGAPKNILDIGCGTGDFLAQSRRFLPADCALHGIEPSIEACAHANAKGIRATNTTIENTEYEGKVFDVLSMVHVLEHFPSIAKVFQSINKLTHENSSLFIEVPNTEKPEFSISGWFGVEHILHFTQVSLEHTLQKYGWTNTTWDSPKQSNIIRVIAMKKPPKPSHACAPRGDKGDISTIENAENILRSYTYKEEEKRCELSKKITETIENWTNKNFRIGIYGAGAHSIYLDSLVNFTNICSAFIDSDPVKQGTIFLGKPVLSPEEIDAELDAIIISSHRFSDDIKKTIQKLSALPDSHVIGLY